MSTGVNSLDAMTPRASMPNGASLESILTGGRGCRMCLVGREEEGRLHYAPCVWELAGRSVSQ